MPFSFLKRRLNSTNCKRLHEIDVMLQLTCAGGGILFNRLLLTRGHDK